MQFCWPYHRLTFSHHTLFNSHVKNQSREAEKNYPREEKHSEGKTDHPSQQTTEKNKNGSRAGILWFQSWYYAQYEQRTSKQDF